ncbi:hypothetical protein HHUSO_G7773 [Huso huso]|uniref:Uncharacterized protein n=1 Tax=Huso huso TaxID=61971 RepID=A0ABR0ZVJ5_HUSHU
MWSHQIQKLTKDINIVIAVNAASDVEPSDTEADERQHVSSDILKITESSLEQNQLLLLVLKAKHQLTSEALTDIMNYKSYL